MHYRDPRAPTSPQPRAGAKRVPWAHLHVAVVVPRVAAVSGVHQHCIESIHDRIPVALRHVRADIQELGVPHVLRREDVSGTCAAGGSLAIARAAQLSYESHLSREGDLLSPSQGHSKEDARMSQTPTAPHSWGRAAGLRQSSHCALDHLPPCPGQQSLGPGTPPAMDCRALTFVILPPPKLAKRFSESVRTLEARWMVKRLLADTFFLHLHRKSSSYSSCSTSQMIANPGQAANPTEMMLPTPGTAPGHLLTAMSAGPGPPHKRRELRSGRLYRWLPWLRTSRFSHGAGREALPYCGRISTCFPPAHPQAPSRPQPHTLTWHTCRRSPRPAHLTSQTAPAPALCLRLAARTEERSGHEWLVHLTARLPAEKLALRDNTEHKHRATDDTKPASLPPPRHW